MFGLLGKSRFLDADIEDWCLETWAWLLAKTAHLEHFQRRVFALPTQEFFPPTSFEGHDRAIYIFEKTKQLMHMADWGCQLLPVERPERDQRIGAYNRIQHGASDLGTFSIRDGEVTVTYAADLVKTPRKLIAVFAHELAHYRLATFRSPIPGGNELHELATELTVAFEGFGVFAANAAFQFKQHQDTWGQGWSTGRSGYFSEPTWAFAIALFATLKGVEAPLEHLKPSVADLTRRAMRYLKRNPERLEALQAAA